MNDNEVDENLKRTDEPSRKFFEYYKEASQDPKTLQRFAGIRTLVVSKMGVDRYQNESLAVADIGCGAGTQALMWAQDGHRVFGLDINEDLISEAKKRASETTFDVELVIGSADKIPLASASVDVCLIPELLEHVKNWEACLDEFARILKPGGMLYLSTTNKLCPIQQEFTLPLYSWYPGSIKRYCEKAAITTNPQWVNYATFPAVNWFSYYRLRSEFAKRNVTAVDRMDVHAKYSTNGVKRIIAGLITNVPPIRFLCQMITPYSAVVGTKNMES